MATHIADTMKLIDDAVEGYSKSVFETFGEPVAKMVDAMGIVGVAFIAANALLQWAPIRASDYMKWSIRYILVFAVATSWASFQPIYTIITETPGSIGAALLGATDAPNLNEALDRMITGLFDFSDRAGDQSGLIGISITSVLVWVLGALMACVAIIVTSIGKIGLAMSVSLAPVFVPTLLFKATNSLFESWAKFTIGFAMIPLVSAGIMGAVVGVGEGMIDDAGKAKEMSQAAGFLIVGLGAVIMMAKVPDMVSGLAGTIVATTSGLQEARSAASASKTVGSRAIDATRPRVTQGMSAAGAARAAQPGNRVAAALQDAKMTSDAMKRNREKIGQKHAERGSVVSRAERWEAGRAGMIEAARSNKAARTTEEVRRHKGEDEDSAKIKLIRAQVARSSQRRGS